MSKSITYSIYYPGGNTTALVEGVNFDQQTKKRINDRLMQVELSVEQVGFFASRESLELQMAGGEFCGNAARSLAMTQYSGRSFTTKIQVSGVARSIEVGVDEQGLAWSEIPVKAGSPLVQGVNKSTFVVNLEGITQVVVLVPNIADIRSKAPQKIKQDAYRMLERLDLTETESAAGIIYVESASQVAVIVPVVWVRAIQTLFVETACGSGSMAVALQQALTTNNNLSMRVQQPSGEIITATVAINSGQIAQATIKGSVKLLKKGVLYVK